MLRRFDSLQYQNMTDRQTDIILHIFAVMSLCVCLYVPCGRLGRSGHQTWHMDSTDAGIVLGKSRSMSERRRRENGGDKDNMRRGRSNAVGAYLLRSELVAISTFM